MIKPVNRFIYLFVVYIALMCALPVSAKVFTPGADFIKDNITKTVYPLDTSANAIVLYEKVYYTLYYSNKYGMCQHKYVKKIIKILADAGKEFSNVEDGAYYGEFSFAEFTKPEGATYNWENGEVVETKLDAATSKTETENSNVLSYKFSMPNVRAGSIIEYEYSLDEPKKYVFGVWAYQSTIPKLYSEVEVTTEEKWAYSNFTQSLYPFNRFNDDSDITYADIPDAYYTSFKTGTSLDHRRWVRKNIPAFVKEPYIANIENYTEKILLFSYIQPITGMVNMAYFNSNESWSGINGLYKRSPYFLKELEEHNMDLTKCVYYATKDIRDSLQMVKSIYKYVRDNFTENTSGIKYNQSLQSILEVKRGSITKINLVLIGMLRTAGIKCEPLLLSTTNNMKLRSTLPMSSLLNYMVTKVDVGGKGYLLDPANKYAPFGVLNPVCYNDYTRVIDKDSGYAIHLLPKLLVNKDVLMVNTVSADPLNYLLQYKHFYGNVAGPQNRKLWTTDTSTLRSYIVKGLPSGFELQNFAVQNLPNVDTVLILEYTVKVPWTGDMVYVPVVLKQFYSSNPFKAEERHYPIEFPYARDDVYSINLQAPVGYSFADSATSTTYRFDDNTNLKYSASYDAGRKLLQVNTRLSFKETQYSTRDYKYLKNFFNDVLNVQQTVYAFKKQ